MVFSPKLLVTLKILSTEYQLYACSKIFVCLDFERKSSFFKAPYSIFKYITEPNKCKKTSNFLGKVSLL